MKLMQLKSGTDVRGVAVATEKYPEIQLTDEVVREISASFIAFLCEKKGKNAEELLVSVGHDSRISADRIKTAVIDDAGYLLTAKFMAGHRQAKGNSQFDLYNEIADNFYALIKFIADDLPDDMTKAGHKGYSRLINLLYDIGKLVGGISELHIHRIIDELDFITTQNY